MTTETEAPMKWIIEFSTPIRPDHWHRNAWPGGTKQQAEVALDAIEVMYQGIAGFQFRVREVPIEE